MNRVDQLIERGAVRLQELANKAAVNGGIKSKLANELADDAAFLRKLKPSLIAERARGRGPVNQRPGQDVVAPPGPQLGERPRPPKPSHGGPNPFVVVGVAFAAGILLAKIIDWRAK
jgi:hypothetical protein